MARRFILAVPLALLCLTSPAFAQGEASLEDARTRAVAAGAKQIQIGAHAPLSNTAVFQEPRLGLLVTAGYFPRRGLELSVGGILGLPDAASNELFARAAVYATLPIVRVFAAARAGWYGTAFSGGDVSASDSGARFALDLGLQFNIPRAPGTRVLVNPVLYVSTGSSYEFDPPRFSESHWSSQSSAVLAAAISF